MTASVERFRLQSPSQAHLKRHIAPGITAIPSPLAPYAFVNVALSDDTARDDLKTAMAEEGYVWVETDPPVSGAVSAFQQVTAVLSGTVSENGGAWALLVSTPASPAAPAPPDPLAFQSKGGTTARVTIDLSYTCAVGGAVRLLVNGGAFVNTVVREIQLDVGTNKNLHKVVILPVPATVGYTEYVFTLQITNEGPLSAASCDTANARHNATLAIAEFK